MSFFANLTSQLTSTWIRIVKMIVHVFIPQTIPIHALSSVAFVSGHVGVHVCLVSTIVVVMVVVTLVGGKGHTIHVVDRIARRDILVSAGARGRVDNINVSDIDASLRIGGDTWVVVAFVTVAFVSVGGNTR